MKINQRVRAHYQELENQKQLLKINKAKDNQIAIIEMQQEAAIKFLKG